MFFAIILPASYRNFYYDKFDEIFRREFTDIEAGYFFYNNYEDASAMLSSRQKEYDAVIFACTSVYQYFTRRLKAEIPWFCVPVANASLSRALCRAQSLGWDLGMLSFDTFEDAALQEIYNELEYPSKKYRIKLFPLSPSNPNHSLHAYNFHRDHYTNADKCSGCVTALPECADLLKNAGVPHILAHPFIDEIRKCIGHAKAKILSAMDVGSNISVISVEIAPPPDYIVIDHSDFSTSTTRINILELIYRYASNISGAVFEQGAYQYVIISVAETLKKNSDNFQRCDLLEWLNQTCTNKISIGIGDSASASNALRLSRQAICKCHTFTRNSCVVILDNKSVYTIEARQVSDNGNRNFISYCDMVASQTHIGSETIAKIIALAAREHTKCFTAKSLAEGLYISRRHADRILEQLEVAGYAASVGKEICGKKGRPSRIVELLLSV